VPPEETKTDAIAAVSLLSPFPPYSTGARKTVCLPPSPYDSLFSPFSTRGRVGETRGLSRLFPLKKKCRAPLFTPFFL